MAHDRLDGWQEIGTYLKKSVSTVQRWTKERGLPVHRLPGPQRLGNTKGGVYALRSELDKWMTTDLVEQDYGADGPDKDVQQEPALVEPPEAFLTAADGIGPGSLSLGRPVAGCWFHAAVACVLYALLYAVELFVQVAYQFDTFRSMAIRTAPIVFMWILGTSLGGLWIGFHALLRGKANGTILALVAFAGAGLLVQAGLWPVLPDWPVTESRLQAATPEAAYLRTVLYFLFLAGLFLVIPFHFIGAIRTKITAGGADSVLALLDGRARKSVPGGAIYLKVSWLALILLGMAIFALISTPYMFDNLKPSAYMNRFTQLIELRLILFFLLGVECLLWYNAVLNNIRRECLGTSERGGTS